MSEIKTSATGPVNVVISKQYETVMCQYYELMRSKMTPQSKELSMRFFLTASGNAFRKVMKTIKMVAKANGISVPTASLHRKVIATTAHRDDNLTEGNIRSTPATEKAVDAYETIERLSKKRFFEDAILLKEQLCMNGCIWNDITQWSAPNYYYLCGNVASIA